MLDALPERHVAQAVKGAGAWWYLTLSCGHEAVHPIAPGGHDPEPPTVVRCRDCGPTS